jgi:trehalose 6-phosphate phosphatase
MKSILARAEADRLAAFAGPDTLFAFDFDGTLAPIVANPARARLRAPTRKLLARLAQVRPCAVISGRSLADLVPRLAGLELELLVGNHGAEWHDTPIASLVQMPVRAWRRALHARLAGMPGVVIEDKGRSLAVHYRAAPDPVAAGRRVHAEARGLPSVRLVPGKRVLNLVPAQAPHKGEALVDACRRLGCTSALFLGDDVTDEDVFRMRRPPIKLLGVRVGRSVKSKAPFFVRGQDEVDQLLRRLLTLTAR